MSEVCRASPRSSRSRTSRHSIPTGKRTCSRSTGPCCGAGVYNLDEFRDAVERIPPQEYLAASYYEKWFRAITTLLSQKGVLTEMELHL